ncbi:MAG TPA: hypothetical protein VHJ20_06905 [Polyangia bacterium]|nr:hypothetical protein [Polyangia bacterium]
MKGAARWQTVSLSLATAVVSLVSVAREVSAEPTAAAGARWQAEPSVGVVTDVILGDARAIARWTAGAELAATARREGSPWGGHVALEAEPATDVGPGASLSLWSARLGLERTWVRHIVAAVDVGGTARRLSIENEVTHTAMGAGATLELGWRLLVARRAVATVGAHYSVTRFSSDYFYWQQAGLSLSLGLIR